MFWKSKMYTSSLRRAAIEEVSPVIYHETTIMMRQTLGTDTLRLIAGLVLLLLSPRRLILMKLDIQPAYQ
jgi:hypothetical protein